MLISGKQSWFTQQHRNLTSSSVSRGLEVVVAGKTDQVWSQEAQYFTRISCVSRWSDTSLALIHLYDVCMKASCLWDGTSYYLTITATLPHAMATLVNAFPNPRASKPMFAKKARPYKPKGHFRFSICHSSSDCQSTNLLWLSLALSTWTRRTTEKPRLVWICSWLASVCTKKHTPSSLVGIRFASFQPTTSIWTTERTKFPFWLNCHHAIAAQ